MSLSKPCCFALLCAVMLAPACAKKSEPSAPPEAEATDTQKGNAATLASYNKGDIITFGHYEQDNDTQNGKEPITWIVLDKNDKGQYLIVSEKVLDVKPYDASGRPLWAFGHWFDQPYGWEKSTIRSWLNGYDSSYNAVGNNYTSDNFIDAAFTADEKAKIVATHIPAPSSGHPKVSSANATTDKIFLRGTGDVPDFGIHGYVEATKYAIANGLDVFNCTDVRCSAAWLWLTTGNWECLDQRIEYDEVGIGSPFGIRPALWVQY